MAKNSRTDRRTRVVALRLSGLDWQTIAGELDYANPLTTRRDFARALAASRGSGATTDIERDTELARLDRLQAGIWSAAARGDVKAIDAVLRIMDRRTKLLGLDGNLTTTKVDREIEQLAGLLGEEDPNERAID